MRVISETEAGAQLPEILDVVAGGETVVLTRKGLPVARITPEGSPSGIAALALFERLDALRQGEPGLRVDEILALRDAGRRQSLR
jgi:prevent-host-death family protein